MFNKPELNLFDWWIVQAKPKAESRVIRELGYQGFSTYCPMYRKENLSGQKIKIKNTPLFPCYVFILANQHAKNNIHVIRSTYGVSRLLKVGEVPNTISNEIIYTLKNIEDKNMSVVDSYFKKGDLIKISHGLYKGLRALYEMDDGIGRAVVLLNILNKQVPLGLKVNQLQKI